MGIKNIFTEGMKELKRKSSLYKEKKELKQKEDQLAEQVTQLGQKAWESDADISRYGNMKELMTSVRQRQDELNQNTDRLQQTKKELEEKKDKENETFDGERKEVEDIKKDVDSRLNTEKKELKELQRTKDNARKRIGTIDLETDRLNKKAMDSATPEVEKKEIPKKLEDLAGEKADMTKKEIETANEIQSQSQKISPIQEEADHLQKKINDIRARQKEVIGELDKSLSENKKELDDTAEKLKEADNEQQQNFKMLGQKISEEGEADEAVAEELGVVRGTEKDIKGIEAEILRLEGQGNSSSKSAFMKMISIVASAILLLVIIIIAIVMLLKSGDKTADTSTANDTRRGEQTGQAAVSPDNNNNDAGNRHETPGDLAKQMDDATGLLKQRSKEIHGKDVKAADKSTLTSALPSIGGWKMQSPSFHTQAFGQVEVSNLSVKYDGPNDQTIEISIIDTATASAVLQPWKILFRLNRTVDDDRNYEKISTYKGMPMFERFDKQLKRARIGFLLKERYMIEMKTTGPDSLERLKELMKEFDTSKL
jgi:uncharacterized coiled-coil DUF342 family protein